VAVAEGGRNGEVRYHGEIENTEVATSKLVKKLAAQHRRLTSLTGEIVLYPELAPLPAASDLIKSRALASIICGSETSIDAFLDFALKEAISIIKRYRHIAEALADALILARTLNGGQIETIIHTSDGAKVAAEERKRREAWRAVAKRDAANAGLFRPLKR
jgi:hypothetical protein